MASKTRIVGIELFRILAAFAIICIHIPPFGNAELFGQYKTLSYLISHVCRFAVPYFFLTSGYFLGKNLEERPLWTPSIIERIRKFFFLFIAWSLIYSLLPDVESLRQALTKGFSLKQLPSLFPVGQRFSQKFQTIPLIFLFEGNTGHLWFFTALISGYLMLYTFRFDKTGKILFFASVCLYLFGVLNSNYAATPIGIHLPIPFYYRDGPFLSALFVTLGFKLSKFKKIPRFRSAVFLAFFGFLIQEFEVFFLWKRYNVSPTFDYLIGTVPFAVGLFLMALNIQKLNAGSFFLEVSKLTLGIYLSHLIAEKVIYLFFAASNSAMWQIVFPILIFLLSALWTYVLRKTPLLKTLVT